MNLNETPLAWSNRIEVQPRKLLKTLNILNIATWYNRYQNCWEFHPQNTWLQYLVVSGHRTKPVNSAAFVSRWLLAAGLMVFTCFTGLPNNCHRCNFGELGWCAELQPVSRQMISWAIPLKCTGPRCRVCMCSIVHCAIQIASNCNTCQRLLPKVHELLMHIQHMHNVFGWLLNQLWCWEHLWNLWPCVDLTKGPVNLTTCLASRRIWKNGFVMPSQRDAVRWIRLPKNITINNLNTTCIDMSCLASTPWHVPASHPNWCQCMPMLHHATSIYIPHRMVNDLLRTKCTWHVAEGIGHQH
jgi:hypothetical protein